jgi:hypothetical protein
MHHGADNSLGPHAMFKMIREFYTRNHTLRELSYYSTLESLVRRQKVQIGVCEVRIEPPKITLFSRFTDEEGYSGSFPSSKWLLLPRRYFIFDPR